MGPLCRRCLSRALGAGAFRTCLQEAGGPVGGESACRKEGRRAGLLWRWAPWPRARGDCGVRRQQAARPGLRSAAVRSFWKSEDEDCEHHLAHTVELAVPLCLLYTQQGPIVSKRDHVATERQGKAGDGVPCLSASTLRIGVGRHSESGEETGGAILYVWPHFCALKRNYLTFPGYCYIKTMLSTDCGYLHAYKHGETRPT